MTQEHDPSDIPGFLTEDGAIPLLTQIDYNEGMLFGELQQKVHVSQTTLSKRKDEAINMGLLTRDPRPDDHGNAKRYRLTDRGQELRAELNDRGVTELYREFFQGYDELSSETDEVANWVVDTRIADPDRDYDEEPAHDYYEG